MEGRPCRQFAAAEDLDPAQAIANYTFALTTASGPLLGPASVPRASVLRSRWLVATQSIQYLRVPLSPLSGVFCVACCALCQMWARLSLICCMELKGARETGNRIQVHTAMRANSTQPSLINHESQANQTAFAAIPRWPSGWVESCTSSHHP